IHEVEILLGAWQRSLGVSVADGPVAGPGAAGVQGGHCPGLERHRAGVLVDCRRRSRVGCGLLWLAPPRHSAGGPAPLWILERSAGAGLAPGGVFLGGSSHWRRRHGLGGYPVGATHLLPVGGLGDGSLASAASA